MSFVDETARNGFGALLALAARRWRRGVDHGLQPFGLSEATWLPLIHLARAPTPMRQRELAASLSLDSSAVVRLLDSLQAAGLVERREEENDRRAKAIILTAEGRAMVGHVEASARRLRDKVLAGIPEADIEVALRVLEHVCAVAAVLEQSEHG
ncbi:MAG: MarR family winged helix-turn-helix transcriptional regulator [Phyllobacterium sp.]